MAQENKVRQIVLDTETTGMKHTQGDRVIEIGCVELINRKLTGRTFHTYLNSAGQAIHPKAFEVHKITMDFLADKPLFSQVANDFINFVSGAELLIHNADFDDGFLSSELARINKPPLWKLCKITDTYPMAKGLLARGGEGDAKGPKGYSLDALCKFLEINLDSRVEKGHGALLDAELLAEVYLKMTEGRSPFIDDAAIGREPRPPVVFIENRKPGASFILSDQDRARHEEYLDGLEKSTKKPAVWRAGAPAKSPSP